MLAARNAGTADPVLLSRVIAETLLEKLGAGAEAARESHFAIRMVRVLEMYDVDDFAEASSIGIRQNGARNVESRGGESGARRLRNAIEQAKSQFLPESSPREFVDRTLRLLAAVDSASIDAAQIEDLKRFLAVLSKSLQQV